MNHFWSVFAGSRLLPGKWINYPEAVTRFLKYRFEYVFSIDLVNAVWTAKLAPVAGNVDRESDFVIKATPKSCIDNDLLRVTCKFDLKVAAGDVTDEQLDSYLNDFIQGSSTDLGWCLDKYFEQIKYNRRIVNTRSRIMNCMTRWTEIITR